MAGIWMGTLGAGCAAGPQEDDGDEGGAGTTNATTSGPGGSGGTAGSAGEGGSTGLCATDCSEINTPACFKSVCNEGMYQGAVGSCVVVPDEGASCDDSLFCTLGDTCDAAGTCVGTPGNDCGMTADQCEAVVCDEDVDSCTIEPSANGDPCQASDLCILGATCNNGLCIGGMPNDCFFQPVPDDCHVSVCNPINGMCEPVPGNEGLSCVDLTDLCSVGNTCSAGVCSGGSPKDCTGLTMGCFNGVCDTTTGQCIQQPVPPGGQCAEATDDCNQGICDMNGMCNPNPINEGGACNSNSCIAGQTCSTGTCQGGTPITSCTNGDLCCPSGCTVTNDNDCLTEITIVALNNAHNGNLGGIAGADALCNQEAAAQPGFAGTWKAFLSDSTQHVKDIVPTQFQNLPVKNRNGVTLWNNWNEIFTTTQWIGGSANALYSFDGKEVDESTGASPDWYDADGWHGSTPQGMASTIHCSNWTSTTGNGQNGEWDLGYHLCAGSLGQESDACSQTLAVACVRVGP